MTLRDGLVLRDVAMTLDWIEAGLALLAGSGLNDRERLDTLLLVSGHARATAALARDAADRDSDVSDTVGISRLVTPDRYPEFVRLLADDQFADGPDEPARLLAFGLDRIVAGITGPA